MDMQVVVNISVVISLCFFIFVASFCCWLSSVFLVDEPKGLYIDVSSGATTHEKKNRHKRAAKEAISPPVMKKQKTGACVEEIYNKFILHKRKLKSRKKDDAPYVSSSPLLPHLFLYCTSDK